MTAKDREFIINLIAFIGLLMLAGGGVLKAAAQNSGMWWAGTICMAMGPVLAGARAFFGMKK